MIRYSVFSPIYDTPWQLYFIFAPNIPKVPMKLKILWSRQFYNFCVLASDQNSSKLRTYICIYIYIYQTQT